MNGLTLYREKEIKHKVRNTYSYDKDDYSHIDHYCNWWLMTSDGLSAEYIDGWGEHKKANTSYLDNKYGVRPVIWLELKR